MKSPRQRPAMNLTEPEPAALVAEPFLETEDLSPPVSDPGAVERPMSERRRRRLADDQRRAKERALA
ncbi:MAG: hypothetical protein Q8K90_00540, partial [Brevundimonas sp.]|nr:hypothetical protein [Brevundimonas sp.]